MSHVRLIMLSLVAVLVVGAVASSSASAKTLNRYYEQPMTELGLEKIEASVGNAVLLGTVGGGNTKIQIECVENFTNGVEIEKEGKSKGVVEYKKCEATLLEKGTHTNLGCKVEEPIKFNYTDQLIEGPGGAVEDEYKGTGEKELFVKITIKGCVLFEGKFEVKGTYVASLPEGEQDQTEHIIVFTSTGSKVKFANNPASFTNTVSKVKRTNKQRWYVD
jgi:hypothetical protein